MNKVAPIRRAYHRYDAPECGHGTCAAQVDCTVECAMKALPVIDEKFLDEQINMPAAYSDPNPWEGRAVLAIIVVVILFAIYMATK